MKINIEKIITEITDRLTDANTGSYEADDCAEDYFDDALNKEDIIEIVTKICTDFNNNSITQEDLISQLSDISVEWDINPFNGFFSFKSDTERLEDAMYEFKDYIISCIS